MRVLVLGKGISGEGVHHFLDHMDIPHDYLNTNEVIDYDYDLVIKSPGIPNYHQCVKGFTKSRVISDVELIGMFLNREFIAVTGTNGKTTTVSLINKILNTKYRSVACGNNGLAIGDAVMTSYEKYVLELSSFQLDGIRGFHPNIAVILNMNPAHLDYHQSLDNYYKAKMKMLVNQRPEEYVIFNGDCQNTRQYLVGNGKKISFGKNEGNDYRYSKGILYHGKKRILRIKEDHLLYDKLAAAIVGLIYKVRKRKIKKILKEFKGLNNRLEKIKPNVYNDAKSTNPYSTINALRQFSGNIVLLCGGIDRGEDLSCLRDDLHRLKRVYSYGQTGKKIEEFMMNNNVWADSSVDIYEALAKVKLDADDILLFSPMMASWDQFKDYNERGQVFKEFVSKNM